MMRLLSSERRLHAKGVAASLPREVGTSSGADSSAFLSRPWPFSPTRAWSTARPCGTPFRGHGPEHRDGSRRMRVGDRCRALGRGRRAARSIRFSHDLVRQTLEESLSRARQVRLHARIALTIQASGTPNPEQVVSWARHLTVPAPLVGSAAAVPYLWRVPTTLCPVSRTIRPSKTCARHSPWLPRSQTPPNARLEGPLRGRRALLEANVRGTGANADFW